MKKNLIGGLLMFLFAGMFFAACNNDDDVAMPVELTIGKGQEQLSLTAFADSVAISVKSNYAWTARLENEKDKEWVDLLAGKDSLKVFVSDNVQKTDRVAKIIVSSSGESVTEQKEITLTQKGAGPAMLALDPKNVVLEGDGLLEMDVNITTTNPKLSFAWENDAKPEWMNEAVLEGTVLHLSAKENDMDEERKTYLLVTAGIEGNSKTDTVYVTQNGLQPYIRITPDTVRWEYTGGSEYITVHYNVPEVNMDDLMEEEGWQTEEVETPDSKAQAPITGMKNQTKTYKVTMEPNGQTTELVHSLLFYYDQKLGTEESKFYNAKLCFIVAAAPVAELSVEKNSLVFGKDAKTKSVTVTTNLAATLQANVPEKDQEWCSAAYKDGKLDVTVKANDGEVRSTSIEVVVGEKNNTKRTTIDVTQSSADNRLILSTNEASIVPDGETVYVEVLYDGEWEFTGEVPEWCTVIPLNSQNKIQIEAGLTAASRSFTITVHPKGLPDKGAQLTVSQSKSYKVGDVYTDPEGKPVGIVYKTDETGAHGWVFALQANHDLEIEGKIPLYWSNDVYGQVIGGKDNPFPDVEPVATDENDGRVNMEAVKNNPNLPDGKTWKECYPVVAWVDQFNTENGNMGWYVPAINELADLYEYFAGQPEEVNARIKELGGMEFIITDEVNFWSAYLLFSSTETKNGLAYVAVRVLDITSGYTWHIPSYADLEDEWAADLCGACTRPVLRF